MLTIKRVENSSEFEQAYKIRVEVFVKEQNVPEEIELDEFDKTAVHVVAYRDDEPVGCGRVFMEGDYARIGRVAVLKKERKKAPEGLSVRNLSG
ncbi:GNAT family N-acetyltransferase [Thermoclostridium stercorarium]|nr:GNAT family N-acetyltransferase [Thermoclostridium stercorarium]